MRKKFLDSLKKQMKIWANLERKLKEEVYAKELRAKRT